MTPKKENKPTPKGYTLVEDGGIHVQQFDASNTDENRYTTDNQIFKANRQFIYEYDHKLKDGEKYRYETIADENRAKDDWTLVKASQSTQNTIQSIVITVLPGLKPMIDYIPDYNQTLIQFSYLTESGSIQLRSISGVIENEKNIWMHPPRNGHFKILALNPFPYIKFPCEIGNQWTWSLEIDPRWQDERWATWTDDLTIEYDYVLTGKKVVNSVFGAIECFEVVSKGRSKIGETSLTSLFHEHYGFVKLTFSNIDGTETELRLVGVQE